SALISLATFGSRFPADERRARKSKQTSRTSQNRRCQKPGGFFLPSRNSRHPKRTAMSTKAAPPSDTWHANVEKTSRTDDERIKDITVLPPPEHLIRFFPIRGTPVKSLTPGTRRAIHNIMGGKDDRLLVVMGPCSIHDPAAALDYARRLAAERRRHAGELEILMRVYFEKPRTTA